MHLDCLAIEVEVSQVWKSSPYSSKTFSFFNALSFVLPQVLVWFLNKSFCERVIRKGPRGLVKGQLEDQCMSSFFSKLVVFSRVFFVKALESSIIMDSSIVFRAMSAILVPELTTPGHLLEKENEKNPTPETKVDYEIVIDCSR